MTNTKVFATEDEARIIREQAGKPYLVVGGVPPETAQQVAHRFALAHGLPEIKGYYGIDLTTREFLAP